ncbi:MAG: ribonuclease R [Deltaproteobacteria bacterium]|nr:ribonuclease R [Deltaproteobacteria bacterium]
MSSTLPDDAVILAAFDDESRKALLSSEVLEKLGLPTFQRKLLEQALDALAMRELLSKTSAGRYRLPKRRAASSTLVGYYNHNPRGFGFVVPEDGSEDIFVSATSIAGAMHSDRVAVRVIAGERGREGLVQEIVQRRSAKIPGTLVLRGEAAFVDCDDPRVRGPIIVERHRDARDGDAVLCRITRFPEHSGELPVGEVQGSLGRPGQLDVEVLKSIAREGVEEEFNEDARAEAAALPKRISAEDAEGREDLRHIRLITIDPDDARDHDDAVFVRRTDDGGYLALIAVADVSHYVQPGTALDRDARARGTSIYLPDRAIPMLPRELSSNLASLLEGEDRLTLAVEVHVTADGRIGRSRTIEGVMRSHARLTYSNVAHTLGWSDVPAPSARAEELREDLEIAAELSSLLKSRRMRRGSLELDVPEGRVKFGPDLKTPIDIVQSRRDPGLKRAYSLVEELMLLGNEVVASICVARELPTVYRVHGEPKEEGLLRFTAGARALGHDLDPQDTKSPKKLNKFLRKVAKSPGVDVLQVLLLRAMQQASYSVDNIGHFGLASEAYLHFTSPIRRYPDILVHRVIRQMARRERIRKDPEAIAMLRADSIHSSRMERRAMDVERDVMDLHRCVVAQGHIGETFTAMITAVNGSGAFVRIDEPYLTALLRGSSLHETEWEVDTFGLSVRGRKTGLTLRVGDRLQVEIEDVSLARKSVFVRLAIATLEALRVESRKREKRSKPAAIDKRVGAKRKRDKAPRGGRS